jgi:hypothetical protein
VTPAEVYGTVAHPTPEDAAALLAWLESLIEEVLL